MKRWLWALGMSPLFNFTHIQLEGETLDLSVARGPHPKQQYQEGTALARLGLEATNGIITVQWAQP